MKPLLIAECCQNHNGDRDLLQRMITGAVEGGSDYVKIQCIRSGELTHRERFDEGETDDKGRQLVIKRPYAAEFERLAKLDLSMDDERWFIEECRKAGVKSMTTVFTHRTLRESRELGFDAVKFASYDCPSYPLLREAKKHWKQIFVSTGASYDEEIHEAVAILEGCDFHLLHCVTVYPTPLEEAHLSRITALREIHPRVGYSDHSKPADTGLIASKAALALGASCIERHFTVLGPEESRDGPVSVNPAMMAELRAFADLPADQRREWLESEVPELEALLGRPDRQLSQAELLNRDYYRGRFASRIGEREVQNWEEWPEEV